jgi:hypothetical protein
MLPASVPTVANLLEGATGKVVESPSGRVRAFDGPLIASAYLRGRALGPAQSLSSARNTSLPHSEAPADRAFRIRVANRLTELRLGIDLGEIRTRAAFESALERGGGLSLDDPRVRNACAVAELSAWLEFRREAP